MIESAFFSDLMDVRVSLMQSYDELRNVDEKIAFCESLKTLLCEMELSARYNKTLGDAFK